MTKLVLQRIICIASASIDGSVSEDGTMILTFIHEVVGRGTGACVACTCIWIALELCHNRERGLAMDVVAEEGRGEIA